VITAPRYRYGGGKAGNVPEGAINAPLTPIPGVESIRNDRRAEGGRDEQSSDELKQEAPAMLRHQDRAVTAADLAALAKTAGGVAKAASLPLFHPDHPGIEVPGAVTVVIVPDSDDDPPMPTPDHLDAAARYLDRRRVLTTELYVKGPVYIPIRVETRVEVDEYAAFDKVAREIAAMINRFLDPLGRTLGDTTSLPKVDVPVRAIGQNFQPTSLYGLIQQHPSVKAVTFLAVRVDGQPHEPFNAVVNVPADGMVYGTSDHDIVVGPYSEEDDAP
jgi:predicted phage baseplate assembly protein